MADKLMYIPNDRTKYTFCTMKIKISGWNVQELNLMNPLITEVSKVYISIIRLKSLIFSEPVLN